MLGLGHIGKMLSAPVRDNFNKTDEIFIYAADPTQDPDGVTVFFYVCTLGLGYLYDLYCIEDDKKAIRAKLRPVYEECVNHKNQFGLDKLKSNSSIVLNFNERNSPFEEKQNITKLTIKYDLDASNFKLWFNDDEFDYVIVDKTWGQVKQLLVSNADAAAQETPVKKRPKN